MFRRIVRRVVDPGIRTEPPQEPPDPPGYSQAGPSSGSYIHDEQAPPPYEERTPRSSRQSTLSLEKQSEEDLSKSCSPSTSSTAHKAARYGRPLALSEDRDISLPLEDLCKAASEGRTLGVRTALAYGVDPNKAKTPNDHAPLALAALGNHLSCMQLLIEAGARVDAARADGENALHAAVQSNHVNCVKLLLDHGAKPDDLSGVIRMTPLQCAAESGSTGCVRLLLNYGANTAGGEDFCGCVALHRAATYGYNDIVELLVEAGADINRQGRSGIMPIQLAAQNRRWTTVKLLLSLGANPNGTWDTLTPLLHVLVEGRQTDLVFAALEAGAIPDCRLLPFGRTPLHVCAQKGLVEIAKLLVRAGADVNRLSAAELSPLDLAELKNEKDVILLLRQANARSGPRALKINGPLTRARV